MFIFHDDVILKEVDTGVSRKVLAHSDNLMICEVHISKGAVIAEHTHPHEQSTYILSGRCQYRVGDMEKTVGAGDNVLIPGNVPHEINAITDLVVVDIFSPAREDFLES